MRICQCGCPAGNRWLEFLHKEEKKNIKNMSDTEEFNIIDI